MIDKSNGAYFWFNTFDQSTQWIDNTTCGEISNEFKDIVLNDSLTAAAATAAAETYSEAMEEINPYISSSGDTKADPKSTFMDESDAVPGAKCSDEALALKEDNESKPILLHSFTSPSEFTTEADGDEDKKLEVFKSKSAIDSHDSFKAEKKDNQEQQGLEQKTVWYCFILLYFEIYCSENSSIFIDLFC